MDSLFIDTCPAPGKLLKSFIRLRIVFPAQNGLNSFCNDSRVVFQAFYQAYFVENQFIQSFFDGLQREDRMGKRTSNVPQDRRIGKTPLKSADGEFAGEMLKEGIGEAQVSFGILEIDGVHL